MPKSKEILLDCHFPEMRFTGKGEDRTYYKSDGIIWVFKGGTKPKDFQMGDVIDGLIGWEYLDEPPGKFTKITIFGKKRLTPGFTGKSMCDVINRVKARDANS